MKKTLLLSTFLASSISLTGTAAISDSGLSSRLDACLQEETISENCARLIKQEAFLYAKEEPFSIEFTDERGPVGVTFGKKYGFTYTGGAVTYVSIPDINGRSPFGFNTLIIRCPVDNPKYSVRLVRERKFDGAYGTIIDTICADQNNNKVPYKTYTSDD